MIKYFKLHEFLKKAWLQDDYDLEYLFKNSEKMIRNSKRLMTLMDEVRTLLETPVVISSGLRGKRYNKKVGGATNSWHTEFLGADMLTPNMDLYKAYNILLKSDLVYEELFYSKKGSVAWIHIAVGTAMKHGVMLY